MDINRAFALACGFALFLAPRLAHADDAPLANRLLQPRRSELWFEGIVFGHPGKGLPENELGAAIDFAPYIPPRAEWLRFSLYHAASLGTWGDERHGGFTDEPGVALRLSLQPFHVIDPFFAFRTGVLLSTKDGGHFAIRTSSGAGMRVLNLLMVQAAADWIVALDGRFDTRRTIAPGIALLGGIDACAAFAWCKRRPAH